MKPRTKVPSNAAQFTLVSPAGLRTLWDNFPPLLRDLHQCAPWCKTAAPKFHMAFCDYMRDINHQRAVADARNYLQINPSVDIPGHVKISTVAPQGIEGSAQAELTLAFFTDPITITTSGGVFKNGRHRATALFDAGVSGDIPVLFI